ncbi:hypothetical protein COU59_00760 [Candidatus Pacearchaeota archaeon CG10_big_fil_rev_8_21_14_0_10_34_12]|nr:MAG: hypothetical protein COU59_00760 [Candidatus Pacearchaeota archaeon CG10_big_fil_rev_8_21_14_0_10_34_12]
MNKEYSKISPTAVFCARMRAKQNIPFSKEIINIIDQKFKNSIKDLPNYGKSLEHETNFIPFIEGRYYSLNKVLSKLNNIFIIEIASGLSPRSLEFLNKKNVTYTETELNSLIKIKIKVLNEITNKKNLKIKNLFLMPLNPLNKRDVDKIGKFYQKEGKGKKIVIVNEGLLMYLDKNEKKIFRDNIRYLFEKYCKKGMWLTTDFSRLKKKKQEIKGKENIRNEISKLTKRKFDYFKSEKEVKEFLKKGGFKSVIICDILSPLKQ